MITRLFRIKSADRVNDSDVQVGLRALLFEGVCSQVMDTLTSGAFLVAFALLMGASNTVVGLLAAVSPLTQLLQIPAIYLVDQTPSRKATRPAQTRFEPGFMAGHRNNPVACAEASKE